MSLFENINRSTEEIREKIQAEEKAEIGGLVSNIESFFSQSLTPRMKSSEYLKAASGWVYGCIGVIADEVAGINLKLMKINKGTQVEIDEHPAMDVLYRANNATTRFDLIYNTFQYLELTGEAPWFISKNKAGKPDQIILLRPDRLTVKPGENGELIGGYIYQVYTDSGVQELKLEPNEVVHLKYTDPDHPLRGKGPLQAAALTVDLDNYAERWNTQFFRNSASPAAILRSDKPLAKDVRARLESKLAEHYKGGTNSHKTMVLESGLDWKQVSLSQKDMDFIEQQRFSRDKILAIFRVPRTALGITDDVNRANAEATDYVFAKRTIKPKMQRFVEQLNEFFLPLFGAGTENLYFDFDDPVPENIDQLVQRAQSGISTGYMTINEGREIMGLDPVEGGDELRDPMSFGPVLTEEGIKIKGKKKDLKSSRYQKHLYAARTRKGKALAREKEIIEGVVSEALTPIIASMMNNKVKKIKTKKILGYKNPFKGDDEAVKAAKLDFQTKQLNVATEYEGKVIKKLNTVFEIQKDAIIRSLESGDKMKLDPKVEAERYAKVLKSTMTDMMREQAHLAFQIVGVHDSFNDNAKAKKPKTFLQRLSEFFEIRTFRFATEVTRETNKKLQAAFKEGTEAGESIPELKKRISGLFEEMAAYRSERIARTETIIGSNFATEEAYKESGVVEAKEWLATRDERTDDECAALDGKVVSLSGKFFKDDYFSGEYPPLHVNCRCTLIPVIK